MSEQISTVLLRDRAVECDTALCKVCKNSTNADEALPTLASIQFRNMQFDVDFNGTFFHTPKEFQSFSRHHAMQGGRRKIFLLSLSLSHSLIVLHFYGRRLLQQTMFALCLLGDQVLGALGWVSFAICPSQVSSDEAERKKK